MNMDNLSLFYWPYFHLVYRWTQTFMSCFCNHIKLFIIVSWYTCGLIRSQNLTNLCFPLFLSNFNRSVFCDRKRWIRSIFTSDRSGPTRGISFLSSSFCFMLKGGRPRGHILWLAILCYTFFFKFLHFLFSFFMVRKYVFLWPRHFINILLHCTIIFVSALDILYTFI